MKKRLGLKITIAITCVAAFVYAIFAFRAHQAVETQTDLAHKEGLWTNVSEIANRPKPPTDQNAAIIYQPLCRAFEQDSDKRRLLASKALEPGGEADFEDAYNSAKPYLDQFALAARRPECQFQRPWSQGSGLLLPEYAQLKNAFMIVCTQATILSRKGQPVEALDLIKRFAPMAGQTGTDPMLISGLVQVAMDNLAFRAIHTIVGAHGLEPGVAAHAQEVLNALGKPPDPALELSGECAMMMTLLDSSVSLGEFFGNDGRRYALMSRVPAIRDTWKAELLQLCRDYHAVFAADRTKGGQIISQLAAIDTRRSGNAVLESLFFLNGQWYAQYAMDQSRRNVLRALLISLADWQKTGKMPTTMPSSAAALIDPIASKPLNFAPIPGGFKIWGVDSKGKNHGGVSYDPKREINALEADVVFQYPWSPPVTPPRPTPRLNPLLRPPPKPHHPKSSL